MQSLLDFFALNAVLALLLALLIGPLCLLITAPWFANRAWLLVLLKLVTPPLIAIPIFWATAPKPEIVPVHEETVNPLSAEELSSLLSRLPDMETRSEIESTAVDASPAPFPWESLLGSGLLMGSVFWWSLVAIRIQRFRASLHRVGGSQPASEDVLTMGREVARTLGLRKMPRLEMIDADWSPMLWVLGWTPRVILPRKLWDSLDPDQRRAVLAHEFAHYLRKDHWVRRLELLVLGLYWWLPIAWLAQQQLRRAEEACCDQLVLASLPDHAAKYAEALVETAVYVSKPRLVPLASGGATNVRNLKRRLQMIFQPRLLSRSQKVAIALFLILGLLALPLGFVVGQEKTVPKSGDSTPTPTPTPYKVKPDKTEKPTKPTSESDPLLWKTKPDWIKGENKNNPFAASDVQALKDEIELLQVQMESKMTAIASAEKTFVIAKEISDNTAKLAKEGSVSRAEVLQVAASLVKAQADLDAKKSELAEQKVRVIQAMRRLETMTQPTKPTPSKNEIPKPATGAGTEKVPGGRGEIVEKLSLARDQARKELVHSEKQIAEMEKLTAQMTDNLKKLQDQMAQTQAQLEQLRAQQAEAKARANRSQKEAEYVERELKQLMQDAKSKLNEKKPEPK